MDIYIYIYALYIYIYALEKRLVVWLRGCRDSFSTQGGGVAQEITAESDFCMLPFPQQPLTSLLLSSAMCPISLCVSLSSQVMRWGSSTPPQRTLSMKKALMSSLWDGVCWRPLIGWQQLNHTEGQGGKLTQREWVRVDSNGSEARVITSKFVWSLQNYKYVIHIVQEQPCAKYCIYILYM